MTELETKVKKILEQTQTEKQAVEAFKTDAEKHAEQDKKDWEQAIELREPKRDEIMKPIDL